VDIKKILENLRNLPENQKKIILFTIVILVGILLIFFWINSTKNRIVEIGKEIKQINNTLPNIIGTEPPVIVEYRNFSCPGMTGFSFQYPVFKGWDFDEPKKSITGLCDIALKKEASTDAKADQVDKPKIIVEQKLYSKTDFEIPAEAVSYPNPNGVPYIYTKEELSGGDYASSHYGYAIFYGKEYKYYIDLDNLSEKIGFPSNDFFKKVIGSFKFTK
jgi:hypothetical protein